MKTLIKNDFLYYFKNKTKLLISVLFVLSLIGMLFVYDSFELVENRKEANYPKQYSMESVKIGEYELSKEANYIPFVKDEFIRLDPDKYTDAYWETLEGQEELSNAIENTTPIEKLSWRFQFLKADYRTLLYRDRMNMEVTPFRYELIKTRIDLLDYFEDHPDRDLYLDENAYDDYDLLHRDLEKYQILMDSLTPDDFNEYTITLANYPSRLFEGLYLLVILVFVLLLFYDLFSKDFDNKTYRTIYTGPYPRSRVITAKLLFAILYTFLCILIAFSIGAVYLLLVRRQIYNTTDNRRGWIAHPHFLDINPTTLFNNNPELTLTTILVRNVFSIFAGSSIIILWITIINYISFRLKSSSSALTIGAFTILVIFFVNMFSIKDIFGFILPLFSYNFNYILEGQSYLNVYYTIGISIVYTIILMTLFYKNIKTIDLLDGDSND